MALLVSVGRVLMEADSLFTTYLLRIYYVFTTYLLRIYCVFTMHLRILSHSPC